MPSIFFSLVRKRINGAQPHGRLRHSLTRLSKKEGCLPRSYKTQSAKPLREARQIALHPINPAGPTRSFAEAPAERHTACCMSIQA
jgi:hypothetical protein